MAPADYVDSTCDATAQVQPDIPGSSFVALASSEELSLADLDVTFAELQPVHEDSADGQEIAAAGLAAVQGEAEFLPDTAEASAKTSGDHSVNAAAKGAASVDASGNAVAAGSVGDVLDGTEEDAARVEAALDAMLERVADAAIEEAMEAVVQKRTPPHRIVDMSRTIIVKYSLSSPWPTQRLPDATPENPNPGPAASPTPDLTTSVRMQPTETVGNLKWLLQKPTLTPIRCQRLIYGKRDLVNTSTLEEFPSGTVFILISTRAERWSLMDAYDPSEFSVFLVRYMLKSGADPTMQDAWGATALHHAAASGHAGVCSFYAEDEDFIAVNWKDHQGATALHRAAQCANTDACLVLIHAARFLEVDAVDNQGASALHRAAGSGLVAVCGELISSRRFTKLNARDTSQATALHYAASGGHTCVVQLLTECELFTGVNAVDVTGATVLHRAAAAGYWEVCRFITEEVPSFIDAQAKDRRGRTALQYAQQKAHSKVCRVLAVAFA